MRSIRYLEKARGKKTEKDIIRVILPHTRIINVTADEATKKIYRTTN